MKLNNLMPWVQAVALGHRPELAVYGTDYATEDGTCVRDYIHVMDLAEGHVGAVRKTEETEGLGTVAYNLGTGKGTTVLQMVHVSGRGGMHEGRFGWHEGEEGGGVGAEGRHHEATLWVRWECAPGGLPGTHAGLSVCQSRHPEWQPSPPTHAYLPHPLLSSPSTICFAGF